MELSRAKIFFSAGFQMYLWNLSNLLFCLQQAIQDIKHVHTTQHSFLQLHPCILQYYMRKQHSNPSTSLPQCNVKKSLFAGNHHKRKKDFCSLVED